MKNNNINTLLEKYWNAESTLKEERELKEYFDSKNIHDDHQHLLPLFQVWSTEQKITAPILNIQQKSTTIRRYWTAIAASLLVLIASVYLFQSSPSLDNKNQIIVLDEEAELEDALMTTKKAFAMLSKGIKKGQDELHSGLSNLQQLDIIN